MSTQSNVVDINLYQTLVTLLNWFLCLEYLVFALARYQSDCRKLNLLKIVVNKLKEKRRTTPVTVIRNDS